MRVSLRVTKDSSTQVGSRPIRHQAILLKLDSSPAEVLPLTPTLSLREREPESPLPEGEG